MLRAAPLQLSYNSEVFFLFTPLQPFLQNKSAILLSNTSILVYLLNTLPLCQSKDFLKDNIKQFIDATDICISDTYWKACIVAVILSVLNPQTIGAYVWNEVPDVKVFVKLVYH